MRRIAVLALVTVALFLSVKADTLIRQKSHADEFTIMGKKQPARDESQETWIGQDRMATLTKEQAIIVDLAKNVITAVNHHNKTYVEMALPLDMSKYLPPQFQQMMSATKITVSPNGKSQQVGQWKCTGYDTTMEMGPMKMNMVIWASKDLPFDWKPVREKMFPQAVKASMRLNDAGLQEIMKIEGYWIRTDISMDMMGTPFKSTQEVTEIVTKDAPEGTYSAPADYKKQDAFSMQDFMRR